MVEEYIFQTFEYHRKNGRFCRIIGRAGSQEGEPLFRVEFNDGQRVVVFSSELRPWHSDK